MFNEEGKLTHKRLRAARIRPVGYNSQPIFGIGTIDAESATAWIYGLAKGLQYTGLEGSRGTDVAETVQSNCFYAMYGLIDSADMMSYNLSHIFANGTFQWFNVMAYDPLNMAGAMSVSFS